MKPARPSDSRVLPGLLFCLVFLTSLAARPAAATEVGNSRTFGLGFEVGDPTGLVGKLFAGRSQAIDFGLGLYSVGWGHRCDRGYCDRFGALTLNVDYLWQDNILHHQNVTLDWHIGAGGRFWMFYDRGPADSRTDSVALAGRMPVGLDLMFDRPNFIEIFLELAPTLYIIPGVTFDIEAGLGVRFYF